MESDHDRLGRSFAWLNTTQGLGALNDNIFKLLVTFYLLNTFKGTAPATLIALVSGLFVLPFILFSHAGGVCADRFSKRSIIVAVKVSEIAIMTLGALSMWIDMPMLAVVAIFAMSTQSAFFGPSKFGVIPELVGDAQLSRANSLVVGLTYLAIIIGTFIPSFLLSGPVPVGYGVVGIVCVSVSLAGLFAAVHVDRTPAAGGTRNFSPFFVLDLFRSFRGLRSDKHLYLALLGSAYFLFVGGFLQQNIILYAKEVLLWPWERSGFLYPVAALGIGVGALLCGRLSGRNVEFGLVPLGAFGLTASCVVLFFCQTTASVCTWLFFVGVSCGLFIVPLTAFIQYQVPTGQRGEILALNNFLQFVGVAVAAAIFFGLGYVSGYTARIGFLVAGGLTLVLTILSFRVLPDFLVRFVGVLLTRIAYRLRVVGAEHVPARGPALLVPNHVTLADALLILATQQRRIRYVMYRGTYENARIKPILRLMGVIPISGDDPPRELVKAMNTARQALKDGYLVCIFAEGALSRNGNLRDFKPGYQKIVKGLNVPVIPIHIHGAWGSIFSHFYGRPMTSMKPRTVPYPICVNFGSPLPANVEPYALRLAVAELGAETPALLKARGDALIPFFVRSVRRNWRSRAVNDTTGKDLTYGKLLISVIAMGRLLKRSLDASEYVGVLLPASVASATVNIALTLNGRVPVNLNFTASPDALASAIRQAEISTVLTSKAFLEKLEGFEAPEGTLFLEDLMPGLRGSDKVIALLTAVCTPRAFICRHASKDPDAPATVIFSSGSTAEPKGVVLTHYNLISNISSFSNLLKFTREDRMCASLPFFHSFGYTVTLWCPLLCGFSAMYHPNPLDGATITEIVREHRLTILLSTPTFLMAYIRRGKPEDFATLKYVVTGAEKLKPRIAEAFHKRFGIAPMEGYGTTELSPVVAVNIPDVDAADADVAQVGTKMGSIGHPIPGVAVKIVDVDSGDALGFDQDGLVLVKGPNVMRGYLGAPEKTEAVLREGWYDTGDIGRMDSDGFVVLVDRLSRFSKIAGEMVPHLAIEERIHDALGATEQVCVVLAVPDERKGERIVLLHTAAAGSAEELSAVIAEIDMPNLWKPRAGSLVALDAIPVLGSGKLDLKTLKATALDAFGE